MKTRERWRFFSKLRLCGPSAPKMCHLASHLTSSVRWRVYGEKLSDEEEANIRLLILAVMGTFFANDFMPIRTWSLSDDRLFGRREKEKVKMRQKESPKSSIHEKNISSLTRGLIQIQFIKVSLINLSMTSQMYERSENGFRGRSGDGVQAESIE